jgi:hypothetical protein
MFIDTPSNKISSSSHSANVQVVPSEQLAPAISAILQEFHTEIRGVINDVQTSDMTGIREVILETNIIIMPLKFTIHINV